MRPIRPLAVLAVVTVLAACGDPLRPSDQQPRPSTPQLGIGGYMGSGLSTNDSVSTTSPVDSAGGERGSGYAGNGH